MFDPALPPGCPPAEAEQANCKAFVCVKSSPPSPEDFLTAAERGYNPGGDPCNRHGFSVSLTIEDAAEIQKRFRRSYKFLASADLNSSHGKLKKTDGPVDSHHTLWKYLDVKLEDVFEVVQ
jgi:hypothetical protein